MFRVFCAAHVPPVARYSAPNRDIAPPTHQSPAGQVHVPRVWEITGRADATRIRQVREWNLAAAARHPRAH